MTDDSSFQDTFKTGKNSNKKPTYWNGLFIKEKQLGRGGMAVVSKVSTKKEADEGKPYKRFLAEVIAWHEAEDNKADYWPGLMKKLSGKKQELRDLEQDEISLNKQISNLEEKISASKGPDRATRKRIKMLESKIDTIRNTLPIEKEETNKDLEEFRKKQYHFFLKRKNDLAENDVEMLEAMVDKYGINLPEDMSFAFKITIPPKTQKEQDKKTYNDNCARQQEEGKLLVALNHPNIVNVYSVGSNFLISEFVDTLDSGEIDRLTIGEKVDLAIDVLDALEYVHSAGIIHRDIKPENIFVNKEKHAKLADFGLARADLGIMTQTGQIAGTPRYMPPEQVEGMKKCTDKTDVYSVGCALYKWITGQDPYFDVEAETTWQLLQKIMATPVTPPSEIYHNIPQDLEDMILKMMDKNPANRPSAAEAKQDLINYLSVEEAATLDNISFANIATKRVDNLVPVIRRRTIEKAEKSNWGKWLGYGAVGAAALVLLGVLGYNMFKGKSNDKPIEDPKQIVIENPKPDFTELDNKIDSIYDSIEKKWKQDNVLDNELIGNLVSVIGDNKDRYKSKIEDINEMKEKNEGFEEYQKAVARLTEDELSSLNKIRDLRKSKALKDKIDEKIRDAILWDGRGLKKAKDIEKDLKAAKENIGKVEDLINDYNDFAKETEGKIDDYNKKLKLKLDKEELGSIEKVLAGYEVKINEYKENKFSVDNLTAKISNMQEKILEQKKRIEKEKEVEESYSGNYKLAKTRAEEIMKETDKLTKSIIKNSRYNSIEVGKLKDKIVSLRGYINSKVKEKDIANKRFGDRVGQIYAFFNKNPAIISELITLDEKIENWKKEKPSKRNKRILNGKLEDVNKYISMLEEEGRIGEQWMTMAKGYKKSLGELLNNIKNINGTWNIDYNAKNEQWIVKDIAGKGNHGTIDGKFAGDVKTGKPIVFKSWEDGVKAGYEMFIVETDDGKYGIGLNGGKIIVPGNDNLDFIQELDISMDFMIKKLPGDRTSLLNKYSGVDNQRGYSLDLGLNNNLLNDCIVFYVSEDKNDFKGKKTISSLRFSINRWYNLRCTFSKDRQIIKVNGKTDNDEDNEQIANSISRNKAPLYIGYSSEENSYLYSILKNIEITGK